jgi:MurNAc alpha-1-phosphate uridylyltransferase
MILAAGRGERMRPLTDTTPKPLLDVAGTPLIGWHLKRLAAAGVHDVVINHAWLGEQIEAALGDGAQYGVRIRYSAEGTALETAGGIAKALPLLGEAPFLLISADIFTDYPYASLVAAAKRMAGEAGVAAHLVLAPTDRYQLDFDLDNDGWVMPSEHPRYTYANLAVIHPQLVADITPGTYAKLGPRLKALAAKRQLSGEVYEGCWINVGTPDDLATAAAAAHHLMA